MAAASSLPAPLPDRLPKLDKGLLDVAMVEGAMTKVGIPNAFNVSICPCTKVASATTRSFQAEQHLQVEVQCIADHGPFLGFRRIVAPTRYADNPVAHAQGNRFSVMLGARDSIRCGARKSVG